jgi:hypothetical protein
MPFDGAVAMAADDEQVGGVPVDGLAQHVARVPFHRLELGVGELLLGLVDDAHDAALEVRFHDRRHVCGA